MKFGPIQVVTAYTPAHTFPRTLTYRHVVNDEVLHRVMANAPAPRLEGVARMIPTHDDRALKALQEEIESHPPPYRYNVASGPQPDEHGHLEVRIVRTPDSEPQLSLPLDSL